MSISSRNPRAYPDTCAQLCDWFITQSLWQSRFTLFNFRICVYVCVHVCGWMSLGVCMRSPWEEILCCHSYFFLNLAQIYTLRRNLNWGEVSIRLAWGVFSWLLVDDEGDRPPVLSLDKYKNSLRCIRNTDEQAEENKPGSSVLLGVCFSFCFKLPALSLHFGFPQW